MVEETINSPLEFNFEILGYFQLKEIYDKFIRDNPSYENEFYNILLNNAFLNLKYNEELKLNSFYGR